MVKINEVETFKPTGITALQFECLVYSYSTRLNLRLNKSAVIKQIIRESFEREFGVMDAGEIEDKIEELKNK